MRINLRFYIFFSTWSIDETGKRASAKELVPKGLEVRILHTPPLRVRSSTVGQSPHKRQVAGSNPVGPTIFLFCYYYFLNLLFVNSLDILY